MREWLEAQLAAGLPAFSGSSVAGTVAVKQDLINELLARWLAESRTGTAAKTSAPDATVAARYVKRASVRVENGTVAIDFAVEVP